MQTADITLKSGAILHLSTAPWDQVEALWSAVMHATSGNKEIAKAAHLILASPDVQKALRNVYSWATYNTIQISTALFNDIKIGDALRVDYMEISEKVLEFQLRPFFLMTSLPSTDSVKANSGNPKQP